MRTTVEIPDRQRARLMELAAERGVKGFSQLVQEAIEHYLKHQLSRRDRIKAALKVAGSFTSDEAASLEVSVRQIRARWR